MLCNWHEPEWHAFDRCSFADDQYRNRKRIWNKSLANCFRLETTMLQKVGEGKRTIFQLAQ